jgi:hypothetical protein
MEMTFSRRAFLGGATALAVWPADLWAAGENGGGDADPRVSLWEKPDGTATDSVMARRLYLDLAGRVPTAEEAREYVFSQSSDKREALVRRLLDSREFADYWTM